MTLVCTLCPAVGRVVGDKGRCQIYLVGRLCFGGRLFFFFSFNFVWELEGES